MTNPIQYSSTDYQSVMNDINSNEDLADKPDWWKRIWAGVRDVAGVQINAEANQAYLRTAFSREAVADLLALIDYPLAPYTTASGNIMFHLDPAVSFPVTFSAADMIALSQATLTSSSKQFESRSGKTVTAFSETFTAAVTDLLTVAHAYTTGDKVRVTTAGTLPAPLAINTDYYVIYVNATTIKLATTLALAFAGSCIDITTAGVGVHTMYLFSFQQTCYQQQSVASTAIGTGDNSTAWQTFTLPDSYILDATLAITINSVSWSNSLGATSTSSSKHYKLIHLGYGYANNVR